MIYMNNVHRKFSTNSDQEKSFLAKIKKMYRKMSYPSLTQKVKCQSCNEELIEKNYSNLLRKHPNENASDKRSTDQKMIFAYAKPP